MFKKLILSLQQQNNFAMKQIGKFKLYSMEEVLDKHFGPIGTTGVTNTKNALLMLYTHT